MSPLLKLKKINVGYEEVPVLRDVSLRVDKGEIVALIGGNGAGKTTTLRTISGLLNPQSGNIYFNGENISEYSTNERVKLGISHVPEERELFPHMSVEENLEMGLIFNKDNKKGRFEFIYKIFPRLEERKNQMASTLSGGEQQMLTMGRGLAMSPELYLLDEPSLGLAPNLVLDMFDLIEKINKEGITILLVEQNAEQALNTAERAYLLENGEIKLESKARDLLNDPYIKKSYLH